MKGQVEETNGFLCMDFREQRDRSPSLKGSSVFLEQQKRIIILEGSKIKLHTAFQLLDGERAPS